MNVAGKNMRRKIAHAFILFLVVLLSFTLTGCLSSKKMGGKRLLVKNKIECENKNIETDELYSYIRQKPNRKILGMFRFHMGVYTLASNWKDNKFTNWMENTIGEEPVYLDTMLANQSMRQFELYMGTQGYFDAKVSKKIKKRGKRKAIVKYKIKTNEPYTIRNINYQIDDNELKDFIFRDTAVSLVQEHKPFNIDKLNKERARITNNLRNIGYYYFSKEYINYQADSTVGNKQIDLTLIVSDFQRQHPTKQDSIITEKHNRYIINSITVNPDFDASIRDKRDYDTTVYRPFKNDTTYKYFFISRNENLSIKPKIIGQSIFYKPGDYYRQKEIDETYRRLTSLEIFRFSNIQFRETNNSDQRNVDTLDCTIQLTRSPVNAANLELEGTNSSGDLGVATNIVLQNKNIFKGAEVFNITLNGALEVQQVTGGMSKDEVLGALPFNTLETGINAGLDIPKFLLPIRAEEFSKRNLPQTSINTGFHYQFRPDYVRTIGNVTFGYQWQETNAKRHIVNPFEFSTVKLNPDSSFIKRLEQIQDERLKRSYRDHLTTSSSYSYIFSNQQLSKLSDFIYFRINLESAGNLLQWKNDLMDSPKTMGGNYTLFNIKYSQYLRTDFDFRYYRVFNELNTVVSRFAMGIGHAYGNANILPFEKSFYAGGANGIRAWKIRSLGPGSYSDENNFDKTGDLHLETNLEYRFKIYSFLDGAAFIDAGNIWLLDPSPEYPGGTFYFDMFLADVAVGGGLGLRFDFSFFVFRIDGAMPIRDPKKPVNQRWIDDTFSIKDMKFNFGIGYPF